MRIGFENNNSNGIQSGDEAGLIPLSQAALGTSYGAEYLALLARRNKLFAKKVDGVWHTTRFAISDYIKAQEKVREELNKNLLSASFRKSGSVISDFEEWKKENILAKRTDQKGFRTFHNFSTHLRKFNSDSPQQNNFLLKRTVVAVSLAIVLVTGLSFLSVSTDSPLSRILSDQGIEMLEENGVAASFFGMLSGASEFLVHGLENAKRLVFGTSPDDGEGLTLEPQTWAALVTDPTDEDVSLAMSEVTASFSTEAFRSDLKSELESYIRAQLAASPSPIIIHESSTVFSPLILREEILIADTRPSITRQSDSDSDNRVRGLTSILENGEFSNPTITGGSITGATASLSSANITTLTVTSCTGCGNGSSASSTLLSDSNTFSGTNTFTGLSTLSNLLLTGSSTLQNFTFVNATGSSATTTNFFATNASTTDFRTNTATIGTLTVGNCVGCGGSSASSTLLGDSNTFSGANTFSGLSTLTNLLMTGSSTFLNFTAINSTTTNATSTNLFSTTASSTNLFSSLLTVGGDGLIVDSSRNVGIGTSTPVTLLNIGAGTPTTAASGIQFGSDVQANLYRSGVGTLKTDGNLSILNTLSSGASSALNLFVGGPNRSVNIGSGITTVATAESVRAYNQGLSMTYTSGEGNQLIVQTTYAPTSGTGIYNNTNINPTINQTGGASGVTRGLYVNPTLTSAADFRAIETTVGKVIFGSTSGSVGIGTTTPSHSLTISSTTAPQLSLSAGAGLSQWTVRNAGGNFYLATTTVAGTATSTVSALSILDSGNLGVGIDVPTERLHVSGNLLVTGNATATSATTTNFFATNASTTDFRTNTATIGTLTVGSCVGCGGGASTTLLSDSNTFSGANTFSGLSTLANLLMTGSSTLLNFTAINSTTTNATSTTSFATTASSTNLFSTSLNTGLITSGAINGQTISSTASLTGTLNVTSGLTSLSNLLMSGSSTLLNFTAINSTTTNATTTNFFATKLEVTNTDGIAIKGTSGNNFALQGVSTGGFGAQLTGTTGGLQASCSTGGCISVQSVDLSGSGVTFQGLSSALAVTSQIDGAGNAYFTGNLGLGTTTPWAKLSIGAHNLSLATPLFVVASSSDAIATSTHFIVDGVGNVGIGTTSPYAKLSVTGQVVASHFAATSTTATSTFAGNVAIGRNASGITNAAASTTLTIYTQGGPGDSWNATGLFIDAIPMDVDVATSTGIKIDARTSASAHVVGLENYLGMHYAGNNMIGVYNKYVGSDYSTDNTWGVLNVMDYKLGGDYYGLQNKISDDFASGAVTSNSYGVHTDITNGNSGGATTVTNVYGTYTVGRTFSTGTRKFYGNYVISNAVSNGGTQYGFYADLTAGSSTKYPAILLGGNVGIGTTTPARLLTLASSTASQLMLTDGAASSFPFNFRQVGNMLYVATSSQTTFATSTNTILTLNGTTGNVGIATTSPWRTLSVNGTAAFTSLTNDGSGYYACVNTNGGELATSTTACGASSIKYKENIENISYGLEELLQLRPVAFDWKEDFMPQGSHQIGFIAEEVELIIPEIIGYDSQGEVMNLDYPKLTSVITKALQEIATITGLFKDNLIAWLGETTNGIGDFFANRVRTKELCLSDEGGAETCITKASLDTLLANSGAPSNPGPVVIEYPEPETEGESSSEENHDEEIVEEDLETNENNGEEIIEESEEEIIEEEVIEEEVIENEVSEEANPVSGEVVAEETEEKVDSEDGEVEAEETVEVETQESAEIEDTETNSSPSLEPTPLPTNEPSTTE